ncbi:MAG: hypothetical protein ACLQO7_12480 [Candidatus Bathyarchaeia archaeon]
MNTERLIHAAIFFLLLFGPAVFDMWAFYTYLHNIALVISGVALSWGLILLALYVAFRWLDWKWWS